MAASRWISSRALSTPSSTKETAPTWRPIILDGAGAAAADAASTDVAAVVWRKSRRFMGALLEKLHSRAFCEGENGGAAILPTERRRECRRRKHGGGRDHE